MYVLVISALVKQRQENPWGHWPASMAYLMRSRPMKDSEIIRQVPTFIHMHTQHKVLGFGSVTQITKVYNSIK